MYNPQLDTFVVVYKSGSFTKAAKQLFITPSAVLQQINSLERDLSVLLFTRGKAGLKPTAAGVYLYEQMNRVVDWNRAVRLTLKEIDRQTENTLRVGVPKMHKSRCFYELWTKYSATKHDAALDFVESASGAPTDVAATYASIDLIEFVKLPFSWQSALNFMKLGDTTLIFGVPNTHPLAEKKVFSPEELAGHRIIVNEGPLLNTIKDYVNELKKYGAIIETVPLYNHSVLDKCYIAGNIIIMPNCSADIHPNIRAVHCSFEYKLPYGFFYSDRAAAFIDFVKQQISDGEYIWTD